MDLICFCSVKLWYYTTKVICSPPRSRTLLNFWKSYSMLAWKDTAIFWLVSSLSHSSLTLLKTVDWLETWTCLGWLETWRGNFDLWPDLTKVVNWSCIYRLKIWLYFSTDLKLDLCFSLTFPGWNGHVVTDLRLELVLFRLKISLDFSTDDLTSWCDLDISWSTWGLELDLFDSCLTSPGPAPKRPGSSSPFTVSLNGAVYLW